MGIKALEAKEKDYKVSDTGGLFLLIKTTGAKYWRQKYRFMGKEKLLAIGTYPSVTLKQARKAQEEAKDLLKAGIDPSLYRKQQKARRELEADNSFSAIAREWHARQSNTWAPITARRNLEERKNNLMLKKRVKKRSPQPHTPGTPGDLPKEWTVAHWSKPKIPKKIRQKGESQICAPINNAHIN